MLCPGQGNAPGVYPSPSTLAGPPCPAEEGQSDTCLPPAKSARRPLRGLYRHLDLLSWGGSGGDEEEAGGEPRGPHCTRRIRAGNSFGGLRRVAGAAGPPGPGRPRPMPASPSAERGPLPGPGLCRVLLSPLSRSLPAHSPPGYRSAVRGRIG